MPTTITSTSTASPDSYAPSRQRLRLLGDLRDRSVCRSAVDNEFDEIYQLAAGMGGRIVFAGENDAEIVIMGSAEKGESVRGPNGVRGRKLENRLILEKLGR